MVLVEIAPLLLLSVAIWITLIEYKQEQTILDIQYRLMQDLKRVNKMLNKLNL